MKRYKPLFFKETIQDNANDLATELEKEVQAIFPHSGVFARFTSNIYPVITLTFTLGKDKKEFINGYPDNDPVRTTIFIDNMDKEGIITRPLSAELKQGGGFYIKPEPGQNRVYQRFKVPFRKVTAPPEKIIAVIKKYFLTLKKALQDNRDRMTDEHLKLIGHKF